MFLIKKDKSAALHFHHQILFPSLFFLPFFSQSAGKKEEVPPPVPPLRINNMHNDSALPGWLVGLGLEASPDTHHHAHGRSGRIMVVGGRDLFRRHVHTWHNTLRKHHRQVGFKEPPPTPPTIT